MTVSTEVNQAAYTGNGVTTVFPYTFRILNASNLTVTRIDLQEVEAVLTLGTDYTVTGAGSYNGGAVVLSQPLQSNYSLVIVRDLDIVQETDLRNQGTFFAEVHEDAFDYLTMIIQQVASWFGLALRRPTIKSKFYDAKQYRIANLADPANEQDAVNNRSMKSYVDKMIAGVVGGFGWFIQAGSGAIYRTFQGKMRDQVSISDFGGFPSPTPEGAIDVTNSLLLAISSGAKNISALPGYYIISQTIEIPAGVTISGSGVGYDKNHPTTFIFKGTGPKSYTIPGATSVSVANPDAGAAYLADSGSRGDIYKTNDFNVDFSAAIILNQYSSLVNVGVVPYFNGISGYFDETNYGLSDNWDVGIWLRNAGGARVSYCIAQGHWRKAGFLQTSTDIGVAGIVPECERCHIEFCSFEGLYGGSIRSLHTTTAAANYGFAGTDFINCYFRGLWHNTAHLATSSMLSTPFDRPSGCLEIDGAFSSTGKIRGVQFLNCTFTNRDDIMIFTDNAAEILFSGCYYESQPIKVNGSWLASPIGCRMIATTNSVGIWHKQSSQYGVDTTPYFSVKDVSIRTSGRYDPAKSGVYSPATSVFDDWQDVVFGGSIGFRLRNASQTFNINAADGTNVIVMDASGRIKYVNTLESTGTSINLNRTVAGVSTPAIRVYGTGNVQIGKGDAATSFTFDGAAAPYADGSSNMGLAVYRFGTFFGVNGAINTSDATHKTDPREVSSSEISAFSKIARLPSVWQWLTKYQIEGDDARLHAGPTVQAAIEIMRENGLEWSKYSAFCYDKWDDIPAELDDEGNVGRPAREAGEIYSFRKDELLWWCLRAQIKEFDILSDRVSELENKLI